MKNKYLSLLAILMIAIFLFSAAPIAFATPARDKYPRLDTAYGVVSYPEGTAMGLARAGTIDNLMGMITPAYVTELQGLGWSISANPGFHMCNLGINCRPYTVGPTAGQPTSGGVTLDYNKPENGGPRTPGWPLYPLNITEFRYALNLLVGCQKTDWIAALYSFINVRLDVCIPPASVYWFNPNIVPVPYDPAQAMYYLNLAGFSNSTGVWRYPDGREMRHFWVMCPVEAPPTVTLTGYIVDSWNKFFGKDSSGNNYFIHNPIGFYDELEGAFDNRDFDMYVACWGLARNPDYLYDFFSPEVDIWDANNSPGLDYPQLNDMLHAIKYWAWPNGTKITNFTDMRKVVWDAQELLYILSPYIPLYSRKYHNAYAPGLESWVESLGYGSNIGLTYGYINYKLDGQSGTPDPTKPSWRFQLGGPLARLNPMTSTSAYDWQVLNLIYDGLLSVNPYTHADVLSAAKAWTPFGGYTAYVNASEGVTDGMKLSFQLRPGITWQDGVAFDVNTIKWNYDFIASIQAPRYYDIWANYIKSIVTLPDKIDIYVNASSLWLLYTFAGSCMLLPPQIYGPHGPCDANNDGVVTMAEVTAFKPYNVAHPTVPGLTCLIGTGPWTFKTWNTLTNTVQLDAYTNYWDSKWLREDVDFSGRIDMVDMFMTQQSFGAVPGNPRWAYGQCDVDNSNRIDMIDMFMVQKRFGKITL